MRLAIIVLAAGEGTRMKSSHPKVLHAICGEPMIHSVLDSAEKLGPERTIVIVGHLHKMVREALSGVNVEFVHQSERLGTGHAVAQVEQVLEGFDGVVIVLSGDTPLIRAQTLEKLLEMHLSSGAAATIITSQMDNPSGYGRIVRSPEGTVLSIIEEKDATDEERAITEVNTGTYCFNKEKLFSALKRVKSDNKQGEFYLTDVIGILRDQGEKVMASRIDDPSEVMGVNNRAQLAEAEKEMRRRINEELMLSGVTIIDPDTTYISAKVEIGKDTIIHPMTFISGKTKIGEGCNIGPMSRLIDCKIGNNVLIENSVVRQSIIEDGASIGPFSHIRPETLVRAGAKIGGFVEVKKSEIGRGSKVPHLSYLGDTEVGDCVNIGAGTITCNYDGTDKHKTVIEDEAFIGSDTMLVAPVKVGKGSYTGAGSVITKDVPADSLAVERSEQLIVDNWAKKKKRRV
ncbi:MAG: bifunctional UDP-N-acetylglucosamine diphosphorylase/glucosamine-1-phosphate N-acetyltransferase GlmU [Firmicutes bacterium]|nr:bifunctional UDP-N-acetylglucosamine diphosphorylase/glucosamine-1-phosphate N-acetyltransferase GlmU [Bacillota bacterium]